MTGLSMRSSGGVIRCGSYEMRDAGKEVSIQKLVA
jgi:hypothetical protein